MATLSSTYINISIMVLLFYVYNTKETDPGDCNFDTSFCNWVNERNTDHFDWRMWKFKTPSIFTGPSKDHTSGRGFYIYNEASDRSRRPGHRARLHSPVMKGPKCMSFYTNMYGEYMSCLLVYIKVNGTQSLAWIRAGNRGDRWVKAQVFFNETREFQVIFEVIQGRSWSGDAAIDDITFTNESCSEGGRMFYVTTHPIYKDAYKVDTAPQFDGWQNQFSFTARQTTGDLSERIYFTYQYSTSGQAVITQSFALNPRRFPLDFFYSSEELENNTQSMFVLNRGSGVSQQISLMDSTYERCCTARSIQTLRVGENQEENPNCFPAWIGAGECCFRFFVEDQRTWNGAREQCRRLGGDLAIIDSMETLGNLSKLLTNITTSLSPFHVGLRDAVPNATKPVTWMNGLKVDNRLWQNGYPKIGSTVKCGAITEVHHQLILVACSYITGFICQSTAVDVAFNRPTNSSIDQKTSDSFLAVDSIPATCFYSKLASNPWWSVELAKSMYVHIVKVINNRGCCNTPASLMEILVTRDSMDSGTSSQRCGHVIAYGETLVYEVKCDPPIRGRHVIVRLLGNNATLILCRVSVAAFDTKEESRGVRRDIWYKLINTQGLSTIRENRVFNTKPYGVSMLQDFNASFEVAEDHGQLLTGYLQVPSSGNYRFHVSCDDECELWISKYDEADLLFRQDDIYNGVGNLLVQIQKWAGYNESTGCVTERPLRQVYLSKCQFYKLQLYTKEGSTFKCLRVGLEKPDGTVEEPIKRQQLFSLKPGVRKLTFDIVRPTKKIMADLGSPIQIQARYKFCCTRMFCPNCSLRLTFHVFNKTFAVSSSLNSSCRDNTFSATLEAVVQPGIHKMEIAYSFASENSIIDGRRLVGDIQVHVAVLENPSFTNGLGKWITEGSNGWKIGPPGSIANSPFAYINEPEYKVELQSPTLPWKPFYRQVGLCLRFSYLMPNMSTSPRLMVYLNTSSGASRLLWTLRGYHGDKWLPARVPWDAQENTKVVFIGATTINGSIAIAVGNINITTERCAFFPPYATPGFLCQKDEFKCTNGHCISKSQRCDSDFNCLDKSDEKRCKCLTKELTCPTGECVALRKICDGTNDCKDGTDEKRCGRLCGVNKFSCPEGKCVSWKSTCVAQQTTEHAQCQDNADQPSVCGSNLCPLNMLNCKESKRNASENCKYSFKGRCDFENGFCGLKHDNTSKLRWNLGNGKTPSANTGPSYDRSTFTHEGSFIFIETSLQTPGDKARLFSDLMNPGKSVCLQFWYHMYGQHIGEFNILASTVQNENVVWTMSGNKGDRWRFGEVMLQFTEPFKFIIEGIRGSGNKGDIAVDDVTLLEGQCSKVTMQNSTDCSFDSMCHWESTGYWELSTGSDGPLQRRGNRGGYLYLNHKAVEERSQVTSPVLTVNERRCVRFWYFIGLGNSAELGLLAYQLGKVSTISYWSTTRRTEVWTYVQISLQKESSIVLRVVFEAFSTGPVVAIDDVSFSDVSCESIPWTPYEGFIPPPMPKCSKSLGMQNYKIPDSSITASTFYRDKSSPSKGRLHLDVAYPTNSLYYIGGWCANPRSRQWLQVDYGSDMYITKVSTQGKQELDFWVTSYSLGYKPNKGSWRWFTERGSPKKFTGNFDRHTVVSHHILPIMRARYVRIYPGTYNKFRCMRVDYFGCPVGRNVEHVDECDSALGIQDGRIPDASITASSSQGSAYRARLHSVGEGGKPGAWVAGVADSNQWLQIDFGGVAMTTKIATQGRHDNSRSLNNWVKSYSISFSQLGRVFEWYKINGTVMVFPANRERGAVVYNTISPPLIARYIRLHPKTWYKHPAMRVEMFGCLAVNTDIKRIKNLGCFKDSNVASIPSVENIDTILEGNYVQRAGAIMRCAEAAHRRGFDVFALQNGGRCLSGPKANLTYNRYGNSTACDANGRGGSSANEVYQITRVCPLDNDLCTWSHANNIKSRWEFTTKENIQKALTAIQTKLANTRVSSLEEFEVHFSNGAEMKAAIPFHAPDAFTICYWVVCQHSSLDMTFYVGDGNNANPHPVLRIRQQECGFEIIVLESKASADQCLCDGNWHHVCITWKSRGGVWEIYADGKLTRFGRWLSGGRRMIDASRLTLIYDARNSSGILKLTDLNVWHMVLSPEDVMRMSYGCGRVQGDVISWNVLRKKIFGNMSMHRNPSCTIERGSISSTMLVTGSTLDSPWFNRSGHGYGKCMKFRYIAYGVSNTSLRIYQTVDGDKMGERPIWSDVGQMDNAWRYGQVSISAVTKHKILIKGQTIEGLSLLAIGGVSFSVGYCRTKPRHAAQACSMNLTESSGHVTSPYYPAYYTDDTPCTWRITVPAEHVIRITVQSFELEDQSHCTRDYVAVYDGIPKVSEKPSLIGKFCGNTYPPLVESSSNEMMIVFKSNNNITRKGFRIYYEAKANKDGTACSKNRDECPASCTCFLSSGKEKHYVVKGASLLAVPKNIPSRTSAIMFGGNRIYQIRSKDFNSITSLEYVDISNNVILRIQDGAFYNLPSLKNIKLSSNFIKDLTQDSFSGLSSLESLDIGENLFNSVDAEAFSSLGNLKVLSLRSNRIKILASRLFENTSNLSYLYLQDNAIEEIPDGIFSTLAKLKVLYLNNNKIKEVSFATFRGLVSLESLYLHNNKLTVVSPGTFKQLGNLQRLTLDHFTLCCYAVKSIPNVNCKAPANEFSSCDDLMMNKTLQACIWVLGILAFVGNIFVVAWRIRVKEDNRVHSILLTNLAISDFMMGVYLLIIAIKDAQWQGVYFKHDIEWRNGMLCQFAGALSMLASEASVLMLTIITMDRFVCIVYPMKFSRLTNKKALVICSVVWTFGVIISFVPVTGLSYFYDEKRDIGFYGRSSVCLPLQLSSDRPAGWEYSVGLFIGLNFIAFMFIVFAYIAMFLTVKKVSAAAGSTNVKKESAMARKLLFIVLTDFCCWMPVIIIGLLSLTGDFHDPQKLAYVWIAVFVLPVNSSINPILYTFSTAHVKKRITDYRNTVSEYMQNSFSSTTGNRDIMPLKTQLMSSRSTHSSSNPTNRPSRFNRKVTPMIPKMKLKFTGIPAVFQTETSNGMGYITCVVDNSNSEYLLKWFSSGNEKEWTREIEVMKKLYTGRDHENLLNYRWHSRGEMLTIHTNDVQIPDMDWNSSCRVICFDYAPTCKNLGKFLQETDYTANMECLSAIGVDILKAIQHLHEHSISHGNISQETVLINKATRIPPIAAFIGAFDNAKVNSGLKSGEAYKQDVQQVGNLLKQMVHSGGYSGDFGGQVREVIDMCFIDATHWKQRISEIRERFENVWNSTSILDSSV